MNEERIKELFSDEKFVKDLFESESFEVAQAKLAANDIDISVDNLKKIFDLLKKKEEGEITDEELEEIAGGFFGLDDFVVGFGIAFMGSFIIGSEIGKKKKRC